jgi:hypothetical protein
MLDIQRHIQHCNTSRGPMRRPQVPITFIYAGQVDIIFIDEALTPDFSRYSTGR